MILELLTRLRYVGTTRLVTFVESVSLAVSFPAVQQETRPGNMSTKDANNYLKEIKCWEAFNQIRNAAMWRNETLVSFIIDSKCREIIHSKKKKNTNSCFTQPKK